MHIFMNGNIHHILYNFKASFLHILSGHLRTMVRVQITFLGLSILLCSLNMISLAAALSSSWEEGIKQFRNGNFSVARELIEPYTDEGLPQAAQAKIYMFAMRDTVMAKPQDTTIRAILEQSHRDPIFTILEARLHLLGYHPDSNKDKGLRTIRGLSEEEGYASFTLGLYYEGKLGGVRDLKKAYTWYDMAKEHHLARSRCAEIGKELDRLDAAAGTGWDGGSTWGGGSEILSGYREDGDHGAERGAGVGSSTVIGRRLERGEDKKGLEGESTYTKTTVGSGAAGGAGAVPATEAGTRAGTSKEEDKSKPVAAGGAGSHGSTTGPSSTQVINIGATAEDLSSVVGGDPRSVASGGAGGAIVPVPPTVPAIAVGHEAFYRRFMEARLEYRPDPKSDAGMIILPIRDLLAPLAGTANPFSGTFDLSRCGDTGKHSSIHTGYKKAKIPANADKLEIWICPKFLVERELDTFKIGGGFFSSPKHPFTKIMHEWEAPMGYFWTWGNDDTSENFDYLLNGICMENDKNLYEKWLPRHTTRPPRSRPYPPTFFIFFTFMA